MSFNNRFNLHRMITVLHSIGLYRIKEDAVSDTLKDRCIENVEDSDDKNKNKVPNDSRIHLIRVRNPWGDKNEWKGKYMDWLKVF